MFKRLISLILTLSFGLQQTVFAYTATLNLSGYLNQGPNLTVSDRFRPVNLRYFSYQPQTNDFKILLDKGDFAKGLSPQGTVPDQERLKEAAKQLMDYFKIGLSLPNDKFWVNLRPDSEDEIIDDELAKTDLGKVMLEADLKLKQDTALFTSPNTPQGKEYWNKLYQRAGELFGTENITIPTLTRPWIVPGEIILRESSDEKASQGAYIYKATLKVMLEEDYLRSQSHQVTRSQSYQVTKSPVNQTEYSFNDPRLKELNQYSTQLIRELILPKLTQKVNSSKDYANLRQVYFSLILARWFKETFSPQSIVHSPQNDSYIKMIDSHNLTNLTSKQAWDKTIYFNAYQKSFKEGEYNLSEPVYTPTGQVIRRYMSGGIVDLMPKLPQISNGFTGENIVSSAIEGKDKVTLNSSDLEIDKGIMKDGVYRYLSGSQSILSGFYLPKAMEIINANLSGKIDFSQAIKDLGDLSISGLSTSGKDTTFRTTSLKANLAAINLAQKYDFSSVILIKFITYLARLIEPAFNPKVTDGITRPTLGLEDTQEKIEELKRILTAYNQKDVESIIKEGERLVSARFSEEYTISVPIAIRFDEQLNHEEKWSNEEGASPEEIVKFLSEGASSSLRPIDQVKRDLVEKLNDHKEYLNKLGKSSLRPLISQMISILSETIDKVPDIDSLNDLEKLVDDFSSKYKEQEKEWIRNAPAYYSNEYMKKPSLGGDFERYEQRKSLFINPLQMSPIREVLSFLEEDLALRLLKAWIAKEKTHSSSSLTKTENPEIVGGIDFRQMNMLIQPQGSFASSSLDFSLPALSRAEIEAFNLDEELAVIQRMASSGITVSDERLKEYLAACFAQGRIGKEIDSLKLCLLDIFERQQFEAKETPDGYKEVLVIADTRGYVLKEGRLAASKPS